MEEVRPAPKWLDNCAQYALFRAVQERGRMRDIALVTMMLHTGLRVSEVSNLRMEDIRISVRKGSVRVRSGKGEKFRTVPLNVDARKALRAYLGEIVVGFVETTVDTVKGTISLIPGVDLMGEEDTALVEALQGAFTPLQAVAFNVFVLLYIPCMVAVAAQRQEYGTRWTLFNAAYLTVLGWMVATLIYQGGRQLGLG